MANSPLNFQDIHWLMEILQNIDVGIVVLDRQHKVQLWNNFMEGHSGISPQKAQEKEIFELFPDLHKEWFLRKTDPVFELRTRAFVSWPHHPYLFKFPNYRPITGQSDCMYQNVTIFPIEDTMSRVNNICLIIYDVTDTVLCNLDIKQ